MSWSVVGAVNNPTDNGARNTGVPSAIAFASAPGTTGDLAIIHTGIRTNAGEFAISETGGQTWTPLANVTQSTNSRARIFWAQLASGWSADPSIIADVATTVCSASLVVYRPSVAGVITASVAQVASAGTADPFTVTGLTTLTDDELVVAMVCISAARTWVIDTTNGWANPGTAQVRSDVSGTSISIATGWLNKVTAGAVANLSWDQSGGTNVTGLMASFKNTPSATDVLIQGRQGLHQQFGTQTAARLGGLLQR